VWWGRGALLVSEGAAYRMRVTRGQLSTCLPPPILIMIRFLICFMSHAMGMPWSPPLLTHRSSTPPSTHCWPPTQPPPPPPAPHSTPPAGFIPSSSCSAAPPAARAPKGGAQHLRPVPAAPRSTGPLCGYGPSPCAPALDAFVVAVCCAQVRGLRRRGVVAGRQLRKGGRSTGRGGGCVGMGCCGARGAKGAHTPNGLLPWGPARRAPARLQSQSSPPAP